MEENLNNQSPEVEASTDDAPVERSVEEQLQATANTLYKEREARKKAEKEAKEYSRKMTDLESKFNSLQQQIASFLSPSESSSQQEQPQPVARRSEYADLNHQLATKQIVSGLQEQLGMSKQETEEERKEKEDVIIESKLFQAYVQAGGLLPGDVSLVEVVDPKYHPFEVIKSMTKEEIKYDPETKDVLFYDRDGKVELNRHGMPITPREKMESYKLLPLFSACFRSDNQNKGTGTPFNSKSTGNVKAKRVSLSEMKKGNVRPEDVLKADYFID